MESNNYFNKWNKINLKDYILTIESGKRPKGGAVLGGIPSLGGEHIDSCGGFRIEIDKLKYVPIDFYKNMKNGIIKKGDILVVKDGATTGKVAYVSEKFPITEASINEHVFLIRTNEQLDSKYLSYYLRSSLGQRNIMNDFRGSTVGGISKDFINFEMLLPTLETQRKVVEVLEKAEAPLDKRKKAIKLLDELVKSKFIEMFGLSEDVTSTKLDKICLKITDGTHQSPQFVREGIPFLFVSNIVNNKINYKTEKFITREEYQLLIKRTPIEIGDVLLTIVGSYGNPAVVESVKEFCFQRHIAYIKPDKEQINSYYLHTALQIPYVRRQIETKVKGIAQKTLNLSELKEIRINVPKMDKQKAFERFYKQVDKLKFEMRKSLEELENNYQSLMKNALNGKINF